MSKRGSSNFFSQVELKSENGFTLIELLIVITIIGILAAIAIPQFNAYKNRAYDSDAKGHLHHMYQACKAYWGDSGSAADCNHTLIIANGAEYGYVPTAEISIVAAGTESSWTANAQNTNSPNSYTVDDAGLMSSP